MLKLEKIARTRDIHVSLRDKQRFFNRSLCTALVYATAMHLLAIGMFHISGFRIGYAEDALEPAIVISDFVPDGSVDMFGVQDDVQEISFFLYPPVATMPEMRPAISCSLEYETVDPEMFATRKHEYIVFNEPNACHSSLFFKDPAPEAPIAINVSGPLADFAICSRNDSAKELVCLMKDRGWTGMRVYSRFCYDVQLDSQAGEVFWWRLSKGDEKAIVKDHAESVLRSLKFKVGVRGCVTGVVEIFYDFGMVQILNNLGNKERARPYPHLDWFVN